VSELEKLLDEFERSIFAVAKSKTAFEVVVMTDGAQQARQAILDFVEGINTSLASQIEISNALRSDLTQLEQKWCSSQALQQRFAEMVAEEAARQL
jgi:hypothetical protein